MRRLFIFVVICLLLTGFGLFWLPRPSVSPVVGTKGDTGAVSGSQAVQARANLVRSIDTDVPWPGRTPAAFRAERVALNPALRHSPSELVREGELIRIPLFDGKAIEARVSRNREWGRDAATFSARAKIAGDPHGFVVLSVVDGVARILINDAANNRVYQIRYVVSQKSHVLLEVDTRGSEVLSCGVCGHEHEIEASPTATQSTAEPFESASVSGLTTLDLMVVYTSAALAFEESDANMQLNISQAVMLANQVHANSLTEVEFNLVHSALVDYTETSSGTYDLNSIMEPADGRIDIVHDWRREYGADFVSFFVSTESFGGMAYRNRTYDRPDRAFSIVRVQQSDTTSYTTVHEISHNMGNGHSKTQRLQPFNEQGVALYAAGWQWADSTSPVEVGYCSVMTYEDFDGFDGDDEYVRVAHLSNPQVDYNGNPTGDPEDGDAARVVREGRTIYESFASPTSLPRFGSFPYTYGFENGETDWAQTFDDVHDWTLRQSGDTPSVETGPESGAYQGNNYAYVEASDHTFQEARLTAEFDFTALTSVSMNFAYNMFDATGFYMGSLALEVSTDEGDTWTELWRRSGAQGPDWSQATVDLSSYAGQVLRLRFVGNVGRGFRSDIAIDAVEVDGSLESDVPTDFNDWISGFSDIVEIAPDQDADKDGLSNFLEYAVGLSPTMPETMADAWSGEWDADGSHLILRFQRARASVLYEVLSLPELGDWTAATTIWSSDTANDLVEVGEEQTVTVEKSGPKRFLRLEVAE